MSTLLGNEGGQIQYLREVLEQVQHTRSLLQRRGTVSRHEMQVSMEQLGVHCGTQTLGSFTQELSPLNLQVALEGLGTRALEIAKELIQKIVAFLKKLVGEVRDYFSDAKAAKDKAVVAKMDTPVNKAQDLIDQVAEYNDARLNTLAMRLKQRLERYEQFSTLDHDLMGFGPLSQAMYSLTDPIEEMMRRLVLVGEDLEKIRQGELPKYGAEEVYAMVGQIAIPRELQEVAGGDDFLDALKRYNARLSVERDSDSAGHVELSERPLQLTRIKELTAPFNGKMSIVRSRLHDIERAAELASRMDTRSIPSEDIANALRKSLTGLLTCVTAVRNYMTWLNDLQGRRSHLIDFVVRYTRDVVELTNLLNAKD